MCRERGDNGNRAYGSPPLAETVSVGRDCPRRRTSGKPSSNNKRKKSTALQKLYSFTPAARAPRSFIQFFREKGILPPFPRHFTSAYCRDLAGSAHTGNRGLGSPHSADHTETLTPPIVRRDKRFAFGIIQKSSLGLFISSHLELSRWRIGRGGVPARLRLHFHGKAFSAVEKLTSRTAHTLFPVALMRPYP